ncbi:ABC transporter substrate-binding protein [Marinomonas sp. 15G1-11]|uniref:ABC transporter substrate-binding protein n=1 Tax=Marinomonas phaeophyticola TaxID=3004091 RepID=A0ABT4JVT6_9GAMM|nr:ABC transporter substrate-binding protein [Marinomonas sp. 15G1-11]MCZ2722336.1 ABC transporter substrate-binding protein [Marinomonas sp. 15G1-11]
MIKKIILPILLGSSIASASEVVFYSTQANPLKEADAMRNDVLINFDGEVKFLPQEAGPFFSRIEAESRAGSVTLGVLGALHGQFPQIQDSLDSIDDVLGSVPEIKSNKTMSELGKLGSQNQKYIPWMQATYIMAANKKALPYLPAGADVNALTYDELAVWAANLKEATGDAKLGFPAGEKGLMHRFLQGYLYPSFTHSVVTDFRGDDAKAMWAWFRDLWQDVNPRSTAYSLMQEPLLTEEVWVAFDHTARLKDAFDQRPDDFIAFPAPSAKAGRGFMPVIAGLAIPAGTPDRAASVELIKYLSQPEVQVKTLKATGFYPIANVELPADLPANVRIAGKAISMQANAADALPSMLPVGLGDMSGQFSKAYKDTFQQIVLRNADIDQILDRQAMVLKTIMVSANAPCWAPDKPSDGVCPVN